MFRCFFVLFFLLNVAPIRAANPLWPADSAGLYAQTLKVNGHYGRLFELYTDWQNVYRYTYPEKALEFSRLALVYAILSRDSGFIFNGQTNYAQALLGSGRYTQGLRYLRHLIGRQPPRMDEGGYLFIEFGNAFYHKDLREIALVFYRKAWREFHVSGHPRPLAITLNNIGLVYEAMGRFDSAFYYFKKGYEIRSNLKDTFLLAHSLHYLAEIQLKRNHIQEAMAYAVDALKLIKSINRSLTPEISLLQMQCEFVKARCKAKQLRFDEAFSDVAASIARFRGTELSPLPLACWQHTLAELHWLHREFSAAEKAAKNALTIYRQSGDQMNEEKVLNLLAEIAQSSKNYQAAYDYLVQKNKLNEDKIDLGLEGEALELETELARLDWKQADWVMKEREKSIHQTQVYFLIILALSILVFVLVFRALMASRKRNRILKSQNEHMLVQQAELTALLRSRDKLYAIIAHDMRTPMSGISGVLKLISSDLADGRPVDLPRYLSMLGRSSENSQTLLDNLLYWTRSLTGRIKVSIQEFELDPMVIKLSGLFHFQMEQKNLQLRNETTGIALSTDPLLFETILRNLLSNAVKFAPRESTITLKSQAPNSITICDDGPGLTAEQMAFFNGPIVGIDVVPDARGSGLGWYICIDFARKLGLTLKASRPETGKGTCISITWP